MISPSAAHATTLTSEVSNIESPISISFSQVSRHRRTNPRRTNVLDRLDLGIANVGDRQLAGALGGRM
jgi:hypothetical protein